MNVILPIIKKSLAIISVLSFLALTAMAQVIDAL